MAPDGRTVRTGTVIGLQEQQVDDRLKSGQEAPNGAPLGFWQSGVTALAAHDKAEAKQARAKKH